MTETLSSFVESVQNLSNTEKLTQIGLDTSALGIPSDKYSFKSLKSIFSEDPFRSKPEMRCPDSWRSFPDKQQPTESIGFFPDTTLFYIFYSQLRDVTQIAAAETLTKRGWVFDPSNGVWTRDNKVFDLHNWQVRALQVANN